MNVCASPDAKSIALGNAYASTSLSILDNKDPITVCNLSPLLFLS